MVIDVIRTCWRSGRQYESADHMAAELRDRFRKTGINPDKTNEMIASWLGPDISDLVG